MKKYIVLIGAVGFLFGCKKSSIFTEIDANFKQLEDVFVPEFKNEPRQVSTNDELKLNAKEAKTGRFGTVLTLDVWEFAATEDAKREYETLINAEKRATPVAYDQTRSNEYRYTFTRSSGVVGEIFTVKKILFRFLADKKETIREYLIASKLGRSR